MTAGSALRAANGSGSASRQRRRIRRSVRIAASLSGRTRPARRRVAVAHDEDLADPPPVGRLDGQRQAVHLDLVAGLRDAADPVVDEPADGVVLVLVLERELDVEQLAEVVHVRPAIDPGLVVGELDDHRLFLVVLVLDLADDLLEQVLDGHQAGRAAVLVEHDREVDLAPLELVEQVVHAHRFGHEDRRAQDGPQRRTLVHAALQERQEVLRVEDADDLVDGLVVDRDRGCGPPR